MYEVNGFKFESQEMAENAKREAKGIEYIKSKTRMDDPEVVFKLYNKLLDKEMFITPVGTAFLQELHDYLIGIPFFKKEDIRQLPSVEKKEKEERERKIRKMRQARELANKQAELEKSKDMEIEKYKKSFQVATFFAVIFGIVIIGMFAIVYFTSSNLDALNYEEEIINKYESWEKELNQREAELNQREADLKAKEE